MNAPNSISLPVLQVAVVQPGNGKFFAHKTSCNAYECVEIGHMFFYSAPFRQKYENMKWDMRI